MVVGVLLRAFSTLIALLQHRNDSVFETTERIYERYDIMYFHWH